ncbi:hypothetical protein Q1695_007306 [Nippostrongylus brasiliensis]|nr:hypothetical protein Q1695_007306 [Nippostrongylus brasiliensis]
MSCRSVHSQLLFGLLIIYLIIVASLASTELHDVSTKSSDAFDYGNNVGGIDLEAFKVLTSMVLHVFCAICLLICFTAANVVQCAKVLPAPVAIIILVFNLVFNIAGCISLWIHTLPNFPEQFSRSIRGNAILSSVALGFNIIVMLLNIIITKCSPETTVTSIPPGGSATVVKAPTKAPPSDSKDSNDTKDSKDSKEKKKSESAEESNEKKGKEKSSPQAARKKSSGGEKNQAKEKEKTLLPLDKTSMDGTQIYDEKVDKTMLPTKTQEEKTMARSMDMTDQEYFAKG